MDLRRKNWAVIAAAVLVATFLGTPGCSNHTGNEWQRLVVEVAAINGGAPLLSGYADAGQDRRPLTEDDVLSIDYVTVEFHARPYDDIIIVPEDTPFSYFHITEYDLTWTPLTDGGAELVNYNLTSAPTDVLVPAGENAAVTILVADRYVKEQPFFHELAPSGPPYYGADKLPFMASCELRFRGHETGTDNVVEVVGAFMVSFVGISVTE